MLRESDLSELFENIFQLIGLNLVEKFHFEQLYLWLSKSFFLNNKVPLFLLFSFSLYYLTTISFSFTGFSLFSFALGYMSFRLMGKLLSEKDFQFPQKRNLFWILSCSVLENKVECWVLWILFLMFVILESISLPLFVIFSMPTDLFSFF